MAPKVSPQDGLPVPRGTRVERAELRRATTKALARVAAIDLELDGFAGKGWQDHKATGIRRKALIAEKEVLVARLKLSAKGNALDKASQKLIERLEAKMTRDARSRKGVGGAVKNFFEQAAMSTAEAGVGLGALAGRLAEFDGLHSAEHAMLDPVRTGEALTKGIATHVKDVYQDNGKAAAAGDVASLVLQAALDTELVGEALGAARRMTAPLPAAIARTVARTTGLSAEATLPAARGAVTVLVAGEVVKEGVKVVALTASADKVGVDVEAAARKKKA